MLGTTVPFGDTFLIVGGDNYDTASDQILQFDPDTESWIVREERLEQGRSAHFAMWVNKADYECS